jgi:hypothetical protein
MSNASQESNWWEFYGVRYAQGTVVGALITFFLFSQSPALSHLLLMPEENKDFGMPHLILLAAYGLTYCYISSAPILILHATRGLLFKTTSNEYPNKHAFCRIATWFIISVIPPAIMAVYSKRSTTIDIAGFWSYTAIISLEIIALLSIFHFKWKETINYHLKTLEKRKKLGESGYVESYKHIREHGNSFLIVFFEFALAIPIFLFVSQPEINKEEAIRNLCLIVFPWIIPAATIWMYGNKLESNLHTM